MSDRNVRRERDRAIARANRLEQELKALKAIIGDIDPTYATAYRDLCDLAHHGTNTTDIHISNHPHSQPPNYNPAAYELKRQERRRQREAAKPLLEAFERLADNRQLTLPGTSTGAHPIHVLYGPMHIATR